MNSVKKAVEFMIDIANSSKHGYDQNYRWGERGDYDCSSLTITAFEKAGFPVKSKYGATYTGNMKQAFIKCGFKDIRTSVNVNMGSGLQYGDILLNEAHHVAVYIGNNKIVQASINELGKATGGKPGDQTGYEINISNYKNYHKGGWDCVLRYISTNNSINTKNKGDDEMVTKGLFKINGKQIEMDRIIKEGYNYIKVSDLIKAGFKVKYDEKTKTVIIDSK